MIGHYQPIGALLNGRYRVLSVLGCGGTSTVYLAEHIQLDTPIALKEVCGRAPESGDHGDVLEQCRREGRLLVRLNHPNLPKVMDAFVENDRFYLAIEYIQGITAARHLEDRMQPLEPHEVLHWGIQIADVLGYLHSQDPPIIFRDLKPNNIIVQPDGRVKLIDFGIARRFHADAMNDTVRLGSFGFSPPEQFGLHQTDPRSDIYSLGATLHYLLTAHNPMLHPFRLPAAAELNPSVPVALSQLISRCVALEPALRPASAMEVRRELALLYDNRVVVRAPFHNTGVAEAAAVDNRAASDSPALKSVILPAAGLASGRSQPAARPVRNPMIRLPLAFLLLLAAGLASRGWLMPHSAPRADVDPRRLQNARSAHVSISHFAPTIHSESTVSARHPQVTIDREIEPPMSGSARGATETPRLSHATQSRWRRQAAQHPYRHSTARQIEQRSHNPLRRSGPARQSVGGEAPAERLRDADLESVLGADNR